MAKNKYQLSQLHKVQVHHNRWFIWALVYLIFIFIALSGYLKVSDIKTDTQELAADSNFSPRHTYSNKNLGFSLRYPPDWAIEAGSDTSVDFLPAVLSYPGVNVSVYDAADEPEIRQALGIKVEKPLTLDGQRGSVVTSLLKGSNVEETVVLVQNEGRLYVIRGPAGVVDEFIITFNFLR